MDATRLPVIVALVRQGITPGSAFDATFLDEVTVDVVLCIMAAILRRLPDYLAATAGVREEFPAGTVGVGIKKKVLGCAE